MIKYDGVDCAEAKLEFERDDKMQHDEMEHDWSIFSITDFREEVSLSIR